MKCLTAYVGTYTTSTESQGIYSLRLDLDSGALTAVELAGQASDPSFLALHPCGKFLYAVSEFGAAVGAFAVSPAGKLAALNQQPSGGNWPCHLTVDREGRNVLVANYGGGCVTVLPIGADGCLASPSQTVQHHGSGPDPKRQEAPHTHSVNLDPTGRFAFVADLGLDKVMVYRFDSALGKLVPHDPPAAVLAPGAGPRHLAFHPGGRLAFVINELASTVTSFAWDGKLGVLRERQTISTLPRDFSGANLAAEVRVHPSGRFLYASNRGQDSIASFLIEPGSGALTALGHEPTLGRSPRHFALDPTGTWLLAANQATDNLVVFRIEAQSGRLKPAGFQVEVPAPVCVTFAAEAR